MSKVTLQALLPGSRCTVADIDLMGKAVTAAYLSSKEDTRWVLVSVANQALGLISLADNIPAIGALSANLKGCRKAETLEEASSWMTLCHKAGAPVMVPVRLSDWLYTMSTYLASMHAALSAMENANSAASVVADAIAKASGQTKH